MVGADLKTMLTPIFYTLEGDELFAPRVAHPGEDAGADIRAYVSDGYKKLSVANFYREYKRQPPIAAANLKGHLFLDGKKFNDTQEEFATAIENHGGAIFLRPGQTVLVNSGFKLSLSGEVPAGTVPVYAIVPRSGLAHKHNVTVTNSPGIVDSGYRDWVQVSLTNNSKNYHAFTHGTRIAQGLIWLVSDQSNRIVTTDETLLENSTRDTGGFGSTDVH